MRHLVEGVRDAVAHESWYAALALTLALPDVCSVLEGWSGGKGYARWFDRYVSSQPSYTIPPHDGKPAIVRLSGYDCYALRCAYLHEGDTDVTGQTQAIDVIERFTFLAPTKSGYTPPSGGFVGAPRADVPPRDRGKRGDYISRPASMFLPINRFCEDVCSGVEAWLADVQSRADVQERIAALPLIRRADEVGGGI